MLIVETSKISAIPMEYNRYKSKLDKVFKKFDIEYYENSTGQFVFDCPFCEGPKKLYWSRKTGMWHCFKCPEHGNTTTLIAKLEKWEYKRAWSWLNSDVERITIQSMLSLDFVDLSQSNKNMENQVENLEIIKVDFPHDFREFLFTKDHIARFKRFYLYLLKRGIDQYMVDHFNILFSTFQERIIFPVYHRGILVGWQGRAIKDDVKPKALTQPAKTYKKSHFLFNYDNIYNEKYITIVEGPIDACKTYLHNSVALFGKSVSEEQLRLIHNMPNLRDIYLAIDPEERDTIKRLYELLSPFYTCKEIAIELGKDCGDKTPQELEKYYNNSRLFNYLDIKPKKI